MTTKPFGSHPETKEALTVTTVTSKPTGLIEVSFTNVGASIVSWKIGRFAKKQELVLGYHDGVSYFASDNPFFGTMVLTKVDLQGRLLGESQIELTGRESKTSMVRIIS